MLAYLNSSVISPDDYAIRINAFKHKKQAYLTYLITMTVFFLTWYLYSRHTMLNVLSPNPQSLMCCSLTLTAREWTLDVRIWRLLTSNSDFLSRPPHRRSINISYCRRIITWVFKWSGKSCTKKIVIISNWKKSLVYMVYTKTSSAL